MKPDDTHPIPLGALQDQIAKLGENLSRQTVPFRQGIERLVTSHYPAPTLDWLEDIDWRNPVNAGGELFFDELQKYIKKLEAELAENEELVVLYRQSGEPIVVTDIGFGGGQILILSGVNLDGQPVQVFASVGSVQLQIMIRRPEERAPSRRPIGFAHR